jgi:hypothetical protein
MCVCISLFGHPIIACWPRLVDGVQVEKGRSVTWAVSLISGEWLVWPKICWFIPLFWVLLKLQLDDLLPPPVSQEVKVSPS